MPISTGVKCGEPQVIGLDLRQLPESLNSEL